MRKRFHLYSFLFGLRYLRRRRNPNKIIHLSYREGMARKMRNVHKRGVNIDKIFVRLTIRNARHNGLILRSKSIPLSLDGIIDRH